MTKELKAKAMHDLGTFNHSEVNHVIRGDIDKRHTLCNPRKGYYDYEITFLAGGFSDDDALRLVACTRCQKILRGLGATEPKMKCSDCGHEFGIDDHDGSCPACGEEVSPEDVA